MIFESRHASFLHVREQKEERGVSVSSPYSHAASVTIYDNYAAIARARSNGDTVASAARATMQSYARPVITGRYTSLAVSRYACMITAVSVAWHALSEPAVTHLLASPPLLSLSLPLSYHPSLHISAALPRL